MASLLDTDVAIHLSEGDPWVEHHAQQLPAPLKISAITRIELENGIYRAPEWTLRRRTAIDELLGFVQTLDFGANEIAAYRGILETTGYSRRKVADRMTAATALVHGIPLVTLNGADFRDVPRLELIAWERE